MELQRCEPPCSRLVRVMLLRRAYTGINRHYHRATFRIFKIERKLHGREDLPFLERVFQKLLLNFTWSVDCWPTVFSKLKTCQVG